ncbi:MAG: 5-(carboxyamino)imidazole ribonucleotide synthase [Phycisphaerales bacterium JB037]
MSGWGARPIVGVLGGGQLGRMLALAAAPLEIEVRLFDPSPDACGGRIAPLTCAPFEDLDAVRRFAEGCDAVTIEFENVPLEALDAAGELAPVRPGPTSLDTARDRAHERGLFGQLGIDTPQWAKIDSLDALRAAAADSPMPAIAKARRGGYDGKGQATLATPDDADRVWNELGGRPMILDERVAFVHELSIITVRAPTGETRCYPLCENEHRSGILHRTLAPAPGVANDLAAWARAAAERVAEALDHIGVLTIEFFEVERADGARRLLANELAPRVHNSGHWTIEFARTSQFENHLRAVLGWPLGSTDASEPCAMFNFVGSVPPMDDLLSVEGARVHLYGKEAKPGRKVGHVSCPAAADRKQRLEDLVTRSVL